MTGCHVCGYPATHFIVGQEPTCCACEHHASEAADLGCVDLRSCDTCGRITDAGEFPDWINGECEDCDPTILDAPENAWRAVQ